jgi:acetate kinase
LVAGLRVLVVNAGSSSLKLSVLDGGATIASATDEPLEPFVARVGVVDAVGHRVVHGGSEFTGPVVVDDAVLARIEALTPLAPLHQPLAVARVRDARVLLPDVPHVACFDTVFHHTIPAAAATYALPAAWRARWPLRRFGFHGLAHAYASRAGAALVGRPVEDLRIVTAHLGSGASLCAVDHGRSVDATMGMTPLDGLVMATRPGSLDPGLVVWLQQHAGLGAAEIAAALEREAGLRGLCGTGDMREVLARRARGDPDATLAFDVYVHRLRQGIAAMTASMGGRDLLVYSGGVGEGAAAVRDAAGCEHVVVEAREDLEIARQVAATV